MASPGLVIAAPASGSGKTLLTLGLLAHLSQRGIRVASAKVGPDYIDPAFHAAATGAPCVNLDAWGMRPDSLDGLVGQVSAGADLVVCEGVMGLFDGAATAGGTTTGATADLAARAGWPVVLVIGARGMASSAAAVLQGFARFRPDVRVAGVVFNRVGGEKHRRVIAQACARACPEVEVLGFLPRVEALVVPSRHLGLVQACEHPDLAAFFHKAAAGAPVFGECGGYMSLGRTLTDSEGVSHALAGLLPLDTSFAQRRLHLGYRQARLLADTPLGPAGTLLRGHEFHYATVTAAAGAPLLAVTDAAGADLGQCGLSCGSVFASFVHLIDRA